MLLKKTQTETTLALVEAAKNIGNAVWGKNKSTKKMNKYDENNVNSQTYHVHIREIGNEPQDEICFRDCLRQNPDTRDEYAQLKYTLAEKYRFNREDYTQEKTEFILKITE